MFQPGMNLNLHVLKIDHLPLAGRLKHCMANWELICVDLWVLGMVRGAHLDFGTPPFQESVPLPHSFSPEEASLVEMEVQEMLQKGAVHKVPPEQSHKGFISNLFLVPKKGVGQRPVINLRNLNQFLRYEHFKMEGVHMLRDLLKKATSWSNWI